VFCCFSSLETQVYLDIIAKSKIKSGNVTDLTRLKEDQAINMMQMASIIGVNIE
jgi:hypothetical protein